jgi:hypothetical protein
MTTLEDIKCGYAGKRKGSKYTGVAYFKFVYVSHQRFKTKHRKHAVENKAL